MYHCEVSLEYTSTVAVVTGLSFAVFISPPQAMISVAVSVLFD